MRGGPAEVKYIKTILNNEGQPTQIICKVLHPHGRYINRVMKKKGKHGCIIGVSRFDPNVGLYSALYIKLSEKHHTIEHVLFEIYNTNTIHVYRQTTGHTILDAMSKLTVKRRI